jgi:hypothetical protein
LIVVFDAVLNQDNNEAVRTSKIRNRKEFFLNFSENYD